MLKDTLVTVEGSSASLNAIWTDGCTDTVVAPEVGDVESTDGGVESFTSVTFADAL
jgi:hypothetical protein